MTTIDTIGAARPALSTRAINRRKALNVFTGWALIVLLAVAPLPFGAVHAFSAGFFGVCFGALSLIYLAGLTSAGAPPNVSMSALKEVVAVYAVYCGYLLLQVLPLGVVLPGLTAFSAGGIEFGSATLSIASNQTMLMLLRHLTFGMLFFLVLQVTQNPSRRELVLNALLAIVMAYCILGVVSLHSGDTVLGRLKTAHEGSATGPFTNRNSFATLLAMGAMLSLVQAGRALVRQATRHKHDGLVPGAFTSTLLFATCYVVLVGTILATNSRMGIAVTFIGSLAVLVVIISKIRSQFGALAITGAVILGALAPATLLFGESILMRLIDDESSAASRFAVYPQVLELIAQRPLLGFGGGAFEQAFALIAHPPVNVDVRWERAHSTYLSLWTELGVIVGSLPLIACGLLTWRLFRGLQSKSEEWAFAAIGLCTMLVVGLHAIVDFSLEIEANALMFTAILGLAVGATFAGDARRGKSSTG